MPEVLLIREDRIDLGVPFYVMRYVDGVVLGVVERYDIVFYSDFSANVADFRQLVRAISRLYRT